MSRLSDESTKALLEFLSTIPQDQWQKTPQQGLHYDVDLGVEAQDDDDFDFDADDDDNDNEGVEP